MLDFLMLIVGFAALGCIILFVLWCLVDGSRNGYLPKDTATKPLPGETEDWKAT